MARRRNEELVPPIGKDEMNLSEWPLGPITSTSAKTIEVEHQAWDRKLRREVTRKMIITGADKFGLPRPIDDQVLIGMKALTHEAGYASRKVEFSRYRLCRIIGWEPSGRSYERLEESLDRIAGTTLKFKDAWWDKGEQEHKSKTFHLIEEVDLCSRDQLDRSRLSNGRLEQQLCSFVWTETIWKSFQDGFIKTLDMRLFRRIARGKRREVPLRLFRILDKRFHYGAVAKLDLRRLCIGTIGMSSNYNAAQMARVIDRAVAWLVKCDFLHGATYHSKGREVEVQFRKHVASKSVSAAKASHQVTPHPPIAEGPDILKRWLLDQDALRLAKAESEALDCEFGSELERTFVTAELKQGVQILQGGRIRQEFVKRFLDQAS